MWNLLKTASAALILATTLGAIGFDHAAMAAKKPNRPQAAGKAETNTLADAQTKLALKLMQGLASGADKPVNVLVSPASLAAVLAYLDLVADGKMDAAIAKTLGIKAGNATKAMNALRDAAKELAAVPPGSGPLSFGNAIFLSPAAGANPDALAQLKGAGMEAMTANLGTPEGVEAVNKWVSDQTAKLIPTIIEKPTPAIFVALNALYFKDKWETSFDSALTQSKPFHLTGGSTADVSMMQLGESKLAFRQDDRFIGVILPYKDKDYDLVVVTTKKDPAPLSDFAGADWLTGTGFTLTKGTVALPRFDAEMAAELLPALNKLGLAKGNRPTSFKKLSSTPITIDEVIQKTVIKVDEEGTAAAAVTALTSRAMSTSGAKPIAMVVDRPFMFALRDNKHQLVLLAGYVGNPVQ
ncbi:serpin family protein [Methyloceanibacter sp.]|uniref:serpin family protein n=1 Tax=Methyloceanibacter sp. TaxID=1965321 RepID=UPI003D6D544B